MKRQTFLAGLLALPFLSFLAKAEPKPKTDFTIEELIKHNYGLFLINNKVKNVKDNPGYAATLSWKLGYTMDRTHGYTMSNFLTDGWTHSIGSTREYVVKFLNDNPFGDTYRVMTKEEVLYLISNRNQGFL